MATRAGSGTGSMPRTAGEPWGYGEQVAAEGDALFRMFKQQQFQAAQQEDQQRNTALRDANQDAQQYGREQRGQDFTREGWDRQDTNYAERSAKPAAISPDAIRFANKLTADLVKELRIPEHAARGITAEAMAESGDFNQMQELKPLVLRSRGGANIMQWTGSRRVALETYAQRNGIDPMDKETGRRFLIEELRGPEGQRLLPHLMKSKDAWEAAQATRQIFLRPQSVQEGWTDEGRNKRVRQRLFLPSTDDAPTQVANNQVPAQSTIPSNQSQSQTNAQVAAVPVAAIAKPKTERTIGPDGKVLYRIVP